MGSGMNLEQAKEYAKSMTYRQAISNVTTGKGIKYRKATMIKLRELAEIADRLDCKTEPQKCYFRKSCDHYGDRQVCGRCREYNLYSHTKTDPQTEYPCDTCVNEGDHDGECSNCFADSEPIRWKIPSHYKPKVEPQTDTDFTLTYTCCFSDCENFKRFGFGEKCIECKRKQKMWKTEPSDSENPNNCEDES